MIRVLCFVFLIYIFKARKKRKEKEKKRKRKEKKKKRKEKETKRKRKICNKRDVSLNVHRYLNMHVHDREFSVFFCFPQSQIFEHART